MQPSDLEAWLGGLGLGHHADTFRQAGIFADVLVDFEGGKRPYGNKSISDDASLELLVLSPDGRLLVRNSRDDCFDLGWNREERDSIQHQAACERRARYEAWRQRLQEYRAQPAVRPDPKDRPGG